MRRTLFYLPHELFSLDGLGFGWLLIAWAVFSVGLMAWLVWRQGFTNDTASYLPVLALFGFVIWWLLPRMELSTSADVPVGLPIRGYGMMVMLGVLAAVGLAAYRARANDMDVELIFSLAMWTFVPGIIGARLFFVIQKWAHVVVRDEEQQIDWAKTLLSSLSITEGGLVVYGAFIGGAIGCLAFAMRKSVSMLALADLIAPSVMVGLALGRIGCLLNGCCFGGVCPKDNLTYPIAITFPRDATPELQQAISPEFRENSPPYWKQRSLGIFHGIRIGTDDAQDPIVTYVDPNLVGEQLKVGDRIALINGVEVESQRIGGITLSQLEHAHELLATSGRVVSITTSFGKTATWTVAKFRDRSLPVHPTQVYSAINAGLIALFLWFYFEFRRRDGQVFAVLLTVYPITRCLLEFIRDDEGGQFGTMLTISQLLSLAVLLASIFFWVYIFWPPGSREVAAEESA